MDRARSGSSWRRALTMVVAGLALFGMALGPVAATASDEVEVDAWGRDANSLKGRIEAVCGPGPSHDASADRPGRVALVAYLAQAFPEVEGFAGFSCREIHNRRGSCVGRERPRHSTCWSTHAGGRAIDVMVGGAGNQDGYPVGGDVGDRVVNHLLETVHGVDNYRARIMGIQQLLWNGACWSVQQHADAGVTDVEQMEQDCVDDHDNHVHITLSNAGADGRTSFHTDGIVRDSDGIVRDSDGVVVDVVEVEPVRPQHLVAYDRAEGELVVRGLDADGTFTDVEARGDLGRGWTGLAAPDVAGNGDDEVFTYRQSNGAHVIREVRGNGDLGSVVSRGREIGKGFTLVAAPDVDGDGDDEVLLYRGSNGGWVLYELDSDGALGNSVASGKMRMDVFFTSVSTPDLDGDGDDEVMLYRRFDGTHEVMDFHTEDLDAAEPEDDPATDGASEGDQASGSEDVPGEGSDEGSDESPGDSSPDTDDEDLDAVEVLDHDGDGQPDDGVLTTWSPGTPSDVEDESAEEAGDDREGVSPFGQSLTPGFTALTATDLDHDGQDEVVLYRDRDGCLAIRRAPTDDVLAGPADEGTESEAVAEEAEPVEDGLQPCLVPPADEAPTNDTESDDADSDRPEVDATTWILESPGALEDGWTALATVALGAEDGSLGE